MCQNFESQYWMVVALQFKGVNHTCFSSKNAYFHWERCFREIPQASSSQLRIWLVMIKIIWSWVGRFTMVFMKDAVTSQNHWRITSWLTNKSLFTTSHLLFYVLRTLNVCLHWSAFASMSTSTFLSPAAFHLSWPSTPTSLESTRNMAHAHQNSQTPS